MYDSRPDTWEHIHVVQGYLMQVVNDLQIRAFRHDQSKLFSPEVDIFDIFTPKLYDSGYDSDEYKQHLIEMGEGLQHHYIENDHHPEWGDGTVRWMDLLQVTELLADWKAATLRHADGDLGRSIEQNAVRFDYGDEMKRLLMNTARNLGWL